MTRYIGLDAHAQSCTFVVLGETGRRLKHQCVKTSAEDLREFMLSIPRPRHLCFEEGNLSDWLFELFEPLVDKLVVVMPEARQGNKSDLLDGTQLAEMLRRGTFTRPVYKAPGQLRELREAVRTHRVLQHDMVQVKQRLNALCRSRGLFAESKGLYQPECRAEVLEKLPVHYRPRAQLFCQQLDALLECVEQAKEHLQQAAKKEPAVKLIVTAPGIGILRASSIVAIMVTPHRFRTRSQLWGYCGLGVVHRTSSDWVPDKQGWKRKQVKQSRGLNRNRHPELKSIFKGAASQVERMPNHPLGRHYRCLIEHQKPNLARLTIARRLASCVLAMWKKGESYDPSIHCPES